VFGVIVPFFLGFYILQFFGFPWEVNLLVAATLTATSIAITMRTLEEMGKLNSLEGNVMINAAVIDDVLGLVVLAVVLSVVTSGVTPHPLDISWVLFRTIAFWLILLAIILLIAPRFVCVGERWRTRETVEVFSTATCFGSAVAAAVMGLSPIIGAFAAGMALASSRVISRVREYIKRLSTLFVPIFFAVIGAEFNIRVFSFEGLGIILILMVVAVVSKLVGCGIPAAVTLRNPKRGLRVGIGMVSRGEVGLIIAGIYGYYLLWKYILSPWGNDFLVSLGVNGILFYELGILIVFLAIGAIVITFIMQILTAWINRYAGRLVAGVKNHS